MTADGGTVAIIATSASGFLCTIATLIYQGLARARERRWDLEDRERAYERTIMHREAVMSALADNTAITTQAANKADAAYSEANQVNMKIAALGTRIAQDAEIHPK